MIAAVRGKRVIELGEEEFSRLIQPFDRLVIDIGTGDGRFPYAYAAANPGVFVIGLDPVKENLQEFSRKASGKAAKGGLANLLYVASSVERAPPELWGRGTDLYVVLPWGRLMAGLILADPEMLDAIVRLGTPAMRLRVVLNGEVWQGSVPAEAAGLPAPTVEHVHEVLAPALRARKVDLTDVRLLDQDEIAQLRSTWARRLSHGRKPRFLYLEGVAGRRGNSASTAAVTGWDPGIAAGDGRKGRSGRAVER